MSTRYKNLLSPIPVGNIVLKNRMISSASMPHFLQGTMPYPTEKVIRHFANRAKNGAAGVTFDLSLGQKMFHPDQADKQLIDVTPEHFVDININDATSQNYICQWIDQTHYYESKAIAIFPGIMTEIQMQEERAARESGFRGEGCNILSRKFMDNYIEEAKKVARTLKLLGFDMFSIHSAYRGGGCFGHFLTPLSNQRSDEYGGSVRNRARFMLEVLSAIKDVVGSDFPIEVLVSGQEPAGGITLDDTVELANMADGLIDILTIRAGELDPQHPTSFTSSPECPAPYLEDAAYIKAHAPKMTICASAGFQSLDLCEQVIAEGKADMIAMARSWICDPEYGKKAYEGRGEDVVPCIRCNKCHVPNDSDKFRSFCSVNPRVGLEDQIDQLVVPPERKKSVGIVGGGPSGLQAAIECAKRGHRVTLYEASNELGGQLKHANYAKFKWPLKQFMEYQIRQAYKLGVTIQRNTFATRALLEQAGHDEVIAAVGPKFKRSGIPGADSEHVFLAVDVFGKEAVLGKKIAVIGGAEVGVETGMYLAQAGHDVTVMTRQKDLALDAAHAHYRTMLVAYYKKIPGFHPLPEVSYRAITPEGVVYADANGNEHLLEADTVVLATGQESNADAALALYSPEYRFHMIGDCNLGGDVAKATRSAFAVASQI